jgi:eukaryotic-like serine/threonine-protein kinase
MSHPSQTTAVLNSLLRTMNDNDDYPALSATISELNKAVDSETSSLNSLTKIILQDFSLTKKLLKVVNTVSYGQFGGKISTISKAVVILGFNVVRDIAAALVLIEFLQNKSQAAQLTDEVIFSFFAGLVARQLTINLNLRNYEEAMICGIFHHLGKLLATFYFFDQSQQINQLIANGISPNTASYEVLGISYNDLGNGIAKSWNFPSRLLYGMQSLPTEKVSSTVNELDQLNMIVNLASELTTLVASTALKDKNLAIQLLAKKYQFGMKVDAKQLHATLQEGMQEMALRASILNIRTKQSPLLKRIEAYTGRALHHESGAETSDEQEDKLTNQLTDDRVDKTEIFIPKKLDSEAILQSGIQDVVNTLVGEYKLNDVLQMVLEAMYLGMGFNRTLLYVRDQKTKTMQARTGFGQDIDHLLPAFNFPLKSALDVFHLAIEKGVDIVIEDINDESINAKIPNWYTKISDAKSFLLLPVMIDKKAIGCFYGDMCVANRLDTSSKNLSLLRTLRNQVILAIKQDRNSTTS